MILTILIIDTRLTSAWKSDHEEDEDEDEAEEPKDLSKEVPEDDASRLKGIQWPGMTVFDAASAEGKRMRNQRKDSKVLRNMMATSKGVEPAEISYHANGEFRGSRDIFGPLSTESSPVRILYLWKISHTDLKFELGSNQARPQEANSSEAYSPETQTPQAYI